MTVEYLRSLEELQRKVNRLWKKAAELTEKAYKLPSFSYGERIRRTKEYSNDALIDSIDAQNAYNAALQEYQERKEELMQAFCSLESYEQAEVMYQRYILFADLDFIEYVIGIQDARRLHAAAVKALTAPNPTKPNQTKTNQDRRKL